MLLSIRHSFWIMILISVAAFTKELLPKNQSNQKSYDSPSVPDDRLTTAPFDNTYLRSTYEFCCYIQSTSDESTIIRTENTMIEEAP